MKRILVMLAILVWGSLAFTSSRVDAVRLSHAAAIPIPVAKGWTNTWGGSADENAGRIATDSAGNLFVVGNFSGSADFNPSPSAADIHSSYNATIDAFLAKYDANGNFLWARTWGGSRRDVAYGVAVDSAGNAYVVGPYMDTVDFNPDPLVTELHTSNGISGTTYHNNIYLSKFAADGRFVWVRTWGPANVADAAGGAEGYTVAVAGNSLYVAGDFSGGTTDFNPWGGHDYHINHQPASGVIFFDAFLSKFDLDGNFQWAKTWGGEGYDDSPGVAVDDAGNLYVAGMYASQNINFDPAGGNGGLGHPAHDSGILVDVFLSKFDSNGSFQWVRTWGGQGTDDAMGLAVVDGANNVYVAGRYSSLNCDFNPNGTPDIHSTNGGEDAFVSKFAPDGTFLWARTWGGSESDNVMGIGVDAWGNLYASGWYSATADFNPGLGVDNHTASMYKDVFLSQLDSNGSFNWAATWGGSGNDSATMILDRAGHVYTAGTFAGSVDFDPGTGTNIHTASGPSDAFVSQFMQVLPEHVYLPALTRSGP